MFSVKLKVKLLLLLVLSVVTLGAQFSGGTVTASCGKCAPIFDEEGNQIGYACIQMGRHNCVATTSGCTFPGLCGGDGGLGPYTPPNGN